MKNFELKYWAYRIAYNINGSFDGTTETNKREAIRYAKELTRKHGGRPVYVYRTLIVNGAHTQQTTVWRNKAFEEAYC